MSDYSFVTRRGEPLKGHLTYIRDDRSIAFEVEPSANLTRIKGDLGTTSLLIGTLQIDVSIETGYFLYPWGYLPESLWEPQILGYPELTMGRVQVKGAGHFQLGVSQRIDADARWKVAFDVESGWLRISPEIAIDARLFSFASDVAVGIQNRELTSVWLKPTIVQSSSGGDRPTMVN